MRTLLLILLLSVSTVARAAAAPDMAEAVRARVESTLPVGLGVVTIALPVGAPVNAGNVAVRWVVPPRSGIVPLFVSWRSNHNNAHGMGQATLAPLRRVLIVSRAMAKGETLGDGDVLATERASESGLQLSVDPRGRTMAHELAAGEPLRATDLMAPAKIARGTQVRVLIRRGGVTIATEGALERPSAVGERTTARVASVPRPITGRLTDEGTLVDEGEIQ